MDLRKVESILLEGGFSSQDIAVVHPQDLEDFIGPNTKVLGISSMDPTGMGYVSKTYSSIVGGGEPMNAIEFRKLIMHPSIKKYKPKIIVGGFGAWQLERKHVSDSYGVDCVLIGGRPKPIVELFKKAVNGEELPRIAKADESLITGTTTRKCPSPNTWLSTAQLKSPRVAGETANSARLQCRTKLMCHLKKSLPKSH